MTSTSARARHRLAGAALALLLLAAAACGDDTTTADAPVIDPGDGGEYNPELDPADFVDVVDNPFFPLNPGARWVYEGVEIFEEHLKGDTGTATLLEFTP